MNVVDAHHHLWDPARREYAWMTGDAAPMRRAFTVEHLRAALPPQVRETVVVQAAPSLDETRELLEIAQNARIIAGVVGWVDLRAADVPAQIASLRSGPGGEYLAGLRHQVQDEPDERWLMRSDVLCGLRAAANAGLAFDLLIRAREIPAALEAARRTPELQFVVDHAAKPEIDAPLRDRWETALAQLAELPHVACKLSGLVTQTQRGSQADNEIVEYAKRVIALFGPERVLFGSDWPVCLLAASYARVFELAERAAAELDAAQRAAVFGENARRVYRLSERQR